MNIVRGGAGTSRKSRGSTTATFGIFKASVLLWLIAQSGSVKWLGEAALLHARDMITAV